MLFTRSRVIHAEFDMWGRLANISVTGETSTRGMLKIKSLLTDYMRTKKKTKDTKSIGKVLFIWIVKRIGNKGKSRRPYTSMQ